MSRLHIGCHRLGDFFGSMRDENQKKEGPYVLSHKKKV